MRVSVCLTFISPLVCTPEVNRHITHFTPGARRAEQWCHMLLEVAIGNLAVLQKSPSALRRTNAATNKKIASTRTGAKH